MYTRPTMYMFRNTNNNRKSNNIHDIPPPTSLPLSTIKQKTKYQQTNAKKQARTASDMS